MSPIAPPIGSFSGSRFFFFFLVATGSPFSLLILLIRCGYRGRQSTQRYRPYNPSLLLASPPDWEVFPNESPETPLVQSSKVLKIFRPLT